MQLNLLNDPLVLSPGAVLLQGFATQAGGAMLNAIAAVASVAPFRFMRTPGGWQMSVAMTNCGEVGWVTDERGYRYSPVDPDSGLPWPGMPDELRQLAVAAARAAGFAGFAPDSCLINRYEKGARMSLHQDRDEHDFAQPIVSVSLGVPALFLWGGVQRRDRPRRMPLEHGDVVVWGGASRFHYHGVAALKAAEHPAAGNLRINLTFRAAR
jgi:alkylated DNA repair protein (DNA oxidative demethylase)